MSPRRGPTPIIDLTQADEPGSSGYLEERIARLEGEAGAIQSLLQRRLNALEGRLALAEDQLVSQQLDHDASAGLVRLVLGAWGLGTEGPAPKRRRLAEDAPPKGEPEDDENENIASQVSTE